MSSIDGVYSPFDEYPGYASMAPCMRSCDHSAGYNGCDQAGCWCNKGNLDLRLNSVTRCASSKCTFANMNTVTDVSVVSGVQIQYCVDKGFSPEGMTVPSTVEAEPTPSDSGVSSVSQTGTTGTSTGSRSSITSGPGPTSSSTNESNNNNNNNGGGGGGGGLSTGAKAGIGIGAAFCALIAILIIVLLFRRKKAAPQYLPPPNGTQPGFQNGAPPMAPTPQQGNGPFNPPLQQPQPVYGVAAGADYKKGDVSPIEEKAVPAVTRKEVGGGISNPVSPAPTNATLVPVAGANEVHGSVPAERHEVSNDGQILNPPVQQYPGQQQYQQSGQGQWAQYGGAQELASPQGQQQGQHPGTYEIGPGR